MWIILGLLLAGIVTGFLLSRIWPVNRFGDHVVRYLIFILLFLMGITVGMNREIINNISEIGVYSLFITLLSISGSIILAKIAFKFLFRKNEK